VAEVVKTTGAAVGGGTGRGSPGGGEGAGRGGRGRRGAAEAETAADERVADDDGDDRPSSLALRRQTGVLAEHGECLASWWPAAVTMYDVVSQRVGST